MSRREDVSNSIWSDPDFAALTPPAKLTYLWSFTNPRCGMAGLYKVPLTHAATDLGIPLGRLQKAIDELAAGRFLHYVDHVLWVRTRVQHLRTRTEQIAKSIRADVESIPESHPLRSAFLDVYADHSWLRDQLSDLRPKFRPSVEFLRGSHERQ